MNRTNVAVLFCLSAGCAAVSLPSVAEDWKRFPTANGYVEVDLDSAMVVEEGVVRALARAGWNPARRVRDSEQSFDYSTAIYEFKCGLQQERISDAVFYLRGERVLEDQPISRDWKDVDMSNAMHRLVCSLPLQH